MSATLDTGDRSSELPATIEKVAIVVSKGSLEGVYPALIMANGARMEGIEAELNSLREENARLRTEIDVVRSEQNAVANRIGHLEASHAETVV